MTTWPVPELPRDFPASSSDLRYLSSLPWLRGGVSQRNLWSLSPLPGSAKAPGKHCNNRHRSRSQIVTGRPRRAESQNSSLGMFTIKIMCLRVLDSGYFSRVTSQQQQGKSSPVVVPENSLQSSKCSESIRRTEPRAPPRVKNSSAECFCFAHGHTTNDERRTPSALRSLLHESSCKLFCFSGHGSRSVHLRSRELLFPSWFLQAGFADFLIL